MRSEEIRENMERNLRNRGLAELQEMRKNLEILMDYPFSVDNKRKRKLNKIKLEALDEVIERKRRSKKC